MANSIRRENGCLEYTSNLRNGYGSVCIGGRKNRKNIRVHRLVYEIMKGPIKENYFVCHKCYNPLCCEISHLFEGTCEDNNRDMESKGRYFRTYGEKSRMHKLTTEQVKLIRQDSRTLKQIANIYNVSKPTISLIKNFKSRLYV